MRHLIFLCIYSFTFMVATNAQSGTICNVQWMHDNLREGDMVRIEDKEMQFELWSNDKQVSQIIRGNNRRYYWYEPIECPPCNKLKIRAIDKNNKELKSTWVSPECPPLEPVLCK